MKAQFKYTFLDSLRVRGVVFAVIFIMNLVFVVLSLLGKLPLAAQITAVSLSGTAIAVMFAVNVVGDVAVIRLMFVPPGAYLCALTPAPKSKTLFASVVSMAIMDAITMSLSILAVVLLSLKLGGAYTDTEVWTTAAAVGRLLSIYNFEIIWGALQILVIYLFVFMIIVFFMVLKRSLFYHKRAAGALSALVVAGVLYAFNLLQFVMIPFSFDVYRFNSVFYTISVGRSGAVAYLVLMFVEVVGLFILSSRLMERKMNI